MNERVKFIAAYLGREETFKDLCERFGVSRKTGYKWVERYDEGGVRTLEDLSRAPKSHPNAVSQEVVDAIVALRRKHPRWGPRKLLVVLERHGDWELPAASTVGDILRRNHLARPRRRKRRSSPYGDRLRVYDAPNSVWCADFKGHFPVGGQRCYPLTITDGFSRYILRCRALERQFHGPSRRVFESAFREFGLPDTIRTDNGAPFATLAPAGLSRLAIWWIRLGIRPERIMPGRPDQNGRHERMHSTLKAETTKPPRSSMRAQQRAFDAFVSEYNQVRPHEALGQLTPASKYRASLRPYPKKLAEPEYPAHFQVERAYPNGVISFEATQWYVSKCLEGELVGLEETDDDRWRVYFGPIVLGMLDLRTSRDHAYRHFGEMVRADGGISAHRSQRRRSYRR